MKSWNLWEVRVSENSTFEPHMNRQLSSYRVSVPLQAATAPPCYSISLCQACLIEWACSRQEHVLSLVAPLTFAIQFSRVEHEHG